MPVLLSDNNTETKWAYSRPFQVVVLEIFARSLAMASLGGGSRPVPKIEGVFTCLLLK